MAILASLPGPNLFSNLPSNPPPNNPKSPNPHPPIPIPKYPPPQNHPKTLKPPTKPTNPAFKTVHYRSKYYKPVSDGVISGTTDRCVIIGDSGVSYLLPGAPFEFQFSYSETPKVKPVAIREPAFLPFAPPTMPRPWTGKAPLQKSKKNIPLFDSFNPPPPGMKGVKHVEMPGPFPMGKFPVEGKTRNEILGEPLKKMEIKMLVKPYLSDNRQVNLGRDGLTHNMLELVHSHWKRQRVCKVKCKGVPTVDMNNVCRRLEEKTGGKIIHRVGGVVYLFRGRNYNYRTRPQYPVMLWKPAAPVYPKLIQEAPEGLTKEEADELRNKGKKLKPICKLAKNGVYITLVKDVRDAFEGSILAKIDCQGMHASDYKKIGAKLKELVPCVLLSFDNEQILMWRGHAWKSMYAENHSPTPPSATDITNLHEHNDAEGTKDSKNELSQVAEELMQSKYLGDSNRKRAISSPKMMSLWKRAIESSKALLLDEINVGPDDLLKKVEDFEIASQATEHSYPASISTSEPVSRVVYREVPDDDDIFGDDDDYGYDSEGLYEESEPSVPLGSLPIDRMVEQLNEE